MISLRDYFPFAQCDPQFQIFHFWEYVVISWQKIHHLVSIVSFHGVPSGNLSDFPWTVSFENILSFEPRILFCQLFPFCLKNFTIFGNSLHDYGRRHSMSDCHFHLSVNSILFWFKLLITSCVENLRIRLGIDLYCHPTERFRNNFHFRLSCVELRKCTEG